MKKSDKRGDQTMTDQVDENATEPPEESAEESQISELDQVVAERDDYLEQLQRSRAEFINFRKRTEQERLKLGDMFTANTLAQFLPVLDDFDRAMEAVPADAKDSGWISGITMIQTKLQGLLERSGVETVDALGASFDPAFHEAVSTEPGTSGSTVVEVYQKGYKLGATLLRPAMVKTGDAEAEESDETSTFDA